MTAIEEDDHSSDIVESLLRNRVAPDIIAEAVYWTIDDVLSLRVELDLPAEDDMNEAMSRLAWKAYESAMEILMTGTASMRMTLIRMMLGSMRGLMNSQSPKEMAALIAQFRGMIEIDEEELDEVSPEESDATVDEDS